MSERNLLLTELRERLWRTDPARQRRRRAPLPLGIAKLDAALPWSGLASSGLHEVLGAAGDAAGFGFAAALLGRLPESAGRILWCRGGPAARAMGRPYGPGLALFGLAPERLILLETRRAQEALWAMEEGLRCRRLAAVVGEGMEVAMKASRRLQLAAEAGDTLGLLLSPPGRVSPSVALTRWRVTAAPAACEEAMLGRSRWRISLLRCRGGGQGEWLVEFDDEALRLVLAAELGDRPLAAAE